MVELKASQETLQELQARLSTSSTPHRSTSFALSTPSTTNSKTDLSLGGGVEVENVGTGAKAAKKAKKRVRGESEEGRVPLGECGQEKADGSVGPSRKKQVKASPAVAGRGRGKGVGI